MSSELVIDGFTFKQYTEAERDLRFPGKFTLKDYLATGGSASVYTQTDAQTGLEVAVKVISVRKNERTAWGARYVTGVAHEHECLRKLDGMPSIPKIYETFVVEGTNNYTFYQVMERVASRTVEDYIDAGELTSELVAKIVPWLLETVADIHDRHVAHRDINLMNITLDENNIYLIDFGEGQDLQTPLPDRCDLGEAPLFLDVSQIGALVFHLSGFGWIDTTSSSDQVALSLVKVEGSTYEQVIRECCQRDPRACPTPNRLRELAALYK